MIRIRTAGLPLVLLGLVACSTQGQNQGQDNDQNDANLNSNGFCGDGVTGALEECDDGMENSDVLPNACRQYCRLPSCGDGVKDEGEVCDKGMATDRCSASCEFIGPEHWVQVQTEQVPEARDGAAMAYDAGRGRIVLFGGTGQEGGVLGDTWEYDGEIWISISTSSSPSPRYAHAMSYDPARRRTLLFGGAGERILNDTWEYDGVEWQEIQYNNAPSVRMWHDMAYDESRGVIVLFGGYGYEVELNDLSLGDTWEHDGVGWREIQTSTAPMARRAHRLAYDPRESVIVLFGGSQGPGETWEFDGIDWHETTPVISPPPSTHFCMGYHGGLGRIVSLVAVESDENDRYAYRTETWEYISGDWEETTSDVAPSYRRGEACAHHAGVDRLILFGGGDGSAPTRMLDDTWAYVSFFAELR